MHVFRRVLFASLTTLLSFLPSDTAAQDHRPPKPKLRYVSVTVALLDELPDPEAVAMVLRRADRYPRDVILLRAGDASLEHLGGAVEALLISRQHYGDVASRNGRISVRDALTPARWRPTDVRQALRVLDRVRSAPPALVDGIGIVRSVQVPLRVIRVRGKVTRQ